MLLADCFFSLKCTYKRKKSTHEASSHGNAMNLGVLSFTEAWDAEKFEKWKSWGQWLLPCIQKLSWRVKDSKLLELKN